MVGAGEARAEGAGGRGQGTVARASWSNCRF